MNEPVGLVTRDGKVVALRGVEVDARILGLIAETSLIQRYRNDTSANLEVAYTFPLPVDGVLLDFEATLGGRPYHGRVMPRREAEAKYEQAVEQGDAAFRLQKLRDGLYTTTLGNLKPGEDVVVRLRYGETLRWQAGRLRYRLPTVIAPRYGEPTGMQPWQKPVSPVASASSHQSHQRRWTASRVAGSRIMLWGLMPVPIALATKASMPAAAQALRRTRSRLLARRASWEWARAATAPGFETAQARVRRPIPAPS